MDFFQDDRAAYDNALNLINLALAEDLLTAMDDLTSRLTIPEAASGSARFVARSWGVLAGEPVLRLLCRRFGLEVGPGSTIEDGRRLEPGSVIARVEGPMRGLLAMERTALNFLQRLSGVATLTSRFVAEVAGTRAVILDTRKTTPGWRALEKYAVRCGGGANHRLGLYDAVLIKDNHLAWLASGLDPIGTAVRLARSQAPPGTKFIEVEVDDLNQLDRALECRPDIILVDNLDSAQMSEAVRRRDARAPGVLLEASGGVNLSTVKGLAESGVDRISVGAITHSAPALDIGLDFEPGDRVVNIALLHRLREAGGGFVPVDGSGPDLDELEAFGFELERHPVLGVAYRGPSPRLCPDQVEWELGTRVIGRRVAVWSRVSSTNDLAARASTSRANEGLAILAEEQTSGRGSRGRPWSAPAGASILMSVLLFPTAPLDDPAWLTALGAVAVAEVVGEEFGLDARIKWPNDVRVDGRKLSGILVERGIGTVLGIGLNVNTAADDFPGDLRESATSLRRLLGRPVDRSEVARSLLRRLDRHYTSAVSAGPGRMGFAYSRRSEHLGHRVEVTTPAGLVAGRLLEIDLGAGLLLSLEDGHDCRVALRNIMAILNQS